MFQYAIDQIDQFGKSYLEKVDSRLAAQDVRLTSIDENVKNIQERAHVWDSFQHHATSWADLMTTVESKIDHISRYKDRRFENIFIINQEVNYIKFLELNEND